MRLFPNSRRSWLMAILSCGLIVMAIALFVAFTTIMPGKSSPGAPAPLSPQETRISANLKKHVSYLAGTIGERNVFRYNALQEAGQYLEATLKGEGYPVSSQYVVEGKTVRNVIAELPGGARGTEMIVIGAHYDTVFDCPGADDNTSGTAALLELAHLLGTTHPARTIRFVAFVNEEPPYFQTANMSSWVYAKRAHERHENIVAAVSLETIGQYSDAEGSQRYPAGFALLYPSKGNFVAFVGNVSSPGVVRDMVRSFRQTTAFPSVGSAVPGWITGVGWSDHWSFWQEGYPAVMVTDTALFRNRNYHLPSDKPETLDYDRTARVVQGLATVITDFGK
jgi:Zn-dependent M28 family amino/carboxypeptidase